MIYLNRSNPTSDYLQMTQIFISHFLRLVHQLYFSKIFNILSLGKRHGTWNLIHLDAKYTYYKVMATCPKSVLPACPKSVLPAWRGVLLEAVPSAKYLGVDIS